MIRQDVWWVVDDRRLEKKLEKGKVVPAHWKSSLKKTYFEEKRGVKGKGSTDRALSAYSCWGRENVGWRS